MKKSTIISQTIVVCIIISSIFLFVSCATVPEEVPYDVTESELLQLAQSAIDNSNTKAARFYFETMISRFGMNHASLVVAEFELAHLDVKEGRFADAKPVLERIISYYEDPQLAAVLPSEYKKLAEIDLAKIPAIE